MHRGVYPLFYRSHVDIPDNRAIRVSKIETIVADRYAEFSESVISVSTFVCKLDLFLKYLKLYLSTVFFL